MPRIPYEPYSTAQPDPSGEQVRVETTPAAFGVNVGQAMEHLGATGQEVSTELFNRALALQDLKNETDARNKVIDFTTQQGRLLANFKSLRGNQPSQQLTPYLKQLADSRAAMRSSLGSPMAQKYFDNEAASFQTRATVIASDHAGDQFKSYVTGTAEAQADLTTRSFVDPFSESEYDQKVRTLEDQSHTVAAAGGMSEAQRQDWLLKHTAIARAGQIEQQGMVNPIKAYGSLQAAIDAGEIDQASADRVRDRIYTQNRGVGARFIANQVFDKSKSPDEMFAEVDKMANDPKYNLGDSDFINHAETALRIKLGYDRSITNEVNRSNEQTVAEAIASGKYHSLQEILADPTVGPAAQALPGQKRDLIDKQIENHFKLEDYATKKANFTMLRDLYYSDRPGAKEDFLNADTSVPMLDTDKTRVLGWRKQMISSDRSDPRVDHAMEYLRRNNPEIMRELGVYYAPPEKADDNTKAFYDNFRGTLQQAIEAFQEVKGHAPLVGSKEFQDEIVKPMFAQHAESGGFFSWLGGTTQVREVARTIPPKVLQDAREELQADAKSRGQDIEPTDHELRMYIVHKQFEQFYKNESKSNAE